MYYFRGSQPENMKTSSQRPVIFLLLLISCSKGNQSPGVQTLLQHNWSIASESTELPACTPADRFVYTGVASDDYNFQTNDSVKVNRAGTDVSPNSPLSVTLHYSLVDDKQIIFINPSTNIHDTTNILRISNDSLILVGVIKYSLLNLCTNAVVSGAANDTLWLFR